MKQTSKKEPEKRKKNSPIGDPNPSKLLKVVFMQVHISRVGDRILVAFLLEYAEEKVQEEFIYSSVQIWDVKLGRQIQTLSVPESENNIKP
jgi:hypothetical protein